MAYGWNSVYGLTKVLGEDLCRGYQTMTGASIAMLRYHEFLPAPYLEFGGRLLRNGVDRGDVAAATVAALTATLERRFDLFRTIVHTDHGMPEKVRAEFATLGLPWVEEQVPGATALLHKYAIALPDSVEQHDLTPADDVLGWKPEVNFLVFLRDLEARDARGDDVTAITLPGTLYP